MVDESNVNREFLMMCNGRCCSNTLIINISEYKNGIKAMKITRQA